MNARRCVSSELWQRYLVLLCSLWAFAFTSAVGQSPMPPGAVLVVSGEVGNPLRLTLDDLKRLPVRQMEDVRQVRTSGTAQRDGEQIRRYSGVLLRDVLGAAQPVETGRHQLRQSIVIASAIDGYKAVFSWAELHLSPIGDGALVIFERDGAPLGTNEGPFALVSLRDTQTGARHVKWLHGIELRRVRD